MRGGRRRAERCDLAGSQSPNARRLAWATSSRRATNGYPGDGINGLLGAFDRAKGNPEFGDVGAGRGAYRCDHSVCTLTQKTDQATLQQVWDQSPVKEPALIAPTVLGPEQ